MKNYVRYKLLLEEPVKMGKQGDQSNTETLTYIVGSSVRGAFLSLYINQYYPGVQGLDKGPESRSELFTETRFSDAWVSIEGKPLFPFPAIYYANKHKLRAAEQTDEKGDTVKLEMHCCISAVPEEGEVRLGRNAYCTLGSESVIQGSVRTEGNLHIAVGRNGNDKKMFRYEAISAGQEFCGLIQCRDESAADKYKKAIDGRTVYLGGSRGSGYGRCKITSAEMIDIAEAVSMYGLRRKEQTGVLTVLALSNLILLNEDGEESGSIDEKLLESKLGISNVKLVKSYVGTVLTSGYNHTWKSWHMQRAAVSAGSLFVYSYEGTLADESITKFEPMGVGQRKEEGFGRIILNPDIERAFLEKAVVKEKHSLPVEQFTEEEENVLQTIERHVNRKRMKDVIEYAARETAEENAAGLMCLSKTQKARLYNLLSDVLDERLYPGEKEAKGRIEKFISEDIKANTKTIYTDKATMRIAGESRSLADTVLLLTDDTKRFADICQCADELEKLCFKGVKHKSDSDFRLKCLFIKEVFYILMRKEGTRA